MQTQTLVLLLTAAIISLAVALFQYFYREKYRTSRNWIFATFRFLTLFGLLVLLINPNYKQISYYTEKPSLAVAIDNSTSIAHLGYKDEVEEVLARFRESETLNQSFDIQYYQFGTGLKALDSLSFSDKQTNIAQVLSGLEDIYGNSVAPVVLVSDGNQTFGTSYRYTSRTHKQQVYPLVAGDTLSYDDIKLGQINVNRYAYINNKFPLEIFASYTGDASVTTGLVVQSGGKTLYNEPVQFSTEKSSQVYNILLPAERVGVEQYMVSLDTLTSEKNKSNNSKNFAIEVIDQKTNVLIVSGITHPDIGMLKKSIESNKLRSVTFAKPQDAIELLNKYELIILYQPTAAFKGVFDTMDLLSINYIILTGPNTNWNALNTFQNVISHEITGQEDQVQGILDQNFSSFLLEDIGFSDFPPLNTSFGDVVFNSEFDVALRQQVGAFETENPLIATTESDGRRGVFIFGEGLWKWRAASFVKTKSFEDFDNFLDNLVQFAASDKKKSRLNLDYESFYYGNGSVKLYAQYFDKNYRFDARASLTIITTNKETKIRSEVPMLLQRSSYEVDLSNLDPGEYSFTVTVDSEELTRSGNFTIVPFEIEKQFLNASIPPLQQLADNTGATLHLLKNSDALIRSLIMDKRYRPVQKRTENIVPLIDWKWLLGVLSLLLGAEWFMRKYSGLT